MAKDGTNRGGARVGAGRKSKALSEKIHEGRAASVVQLPEAPELQGADMPPAKYYMTVTQKSGIELDAEQVYEETWNWLKSRRCEDLVSIQIIHQYAMAVARWIQCEMAVSEYGFLAKHPTTGAAIASPYVAMSREYMKQVNQIWFQIFQIVKENNSASYQGANPQDDLMERLLTSRRNR
jgi:hypothetical protein